MLQHSSRHIFFFGFLVVAALLGAGFYFEYVEGLEPCLLCQAQRLCFMGVGVFCLLAFLRNPQQHAQRKYYLGVLFFSLLGFASALRQVWLISLPPSDDTMCVPGLSFLLQQHAFAEMAKLLVTGGTECGEVDWHFLGLSMPLWAGLFFLGFIASSLFFYIKSSRQR